MKRDIHILMVEGDSEQVFSLREALTVAQILCVDVQEMEDGEEMLAYLRQEYPYLDAPSPDVIFLGLNLPGMSGLEVLEEIQSLPQLRHIPIGILTTSTDSQPLSVPGRHHNPCYVFKKPTSCTEWIYTLRCIEDVWLSIKNIETHLLP